MLINGSAGGVGSLAVQIAKAAGAAVTGVDCTEKLEMVRSLGADRVIDYTREDFTRSGERYDLMIDVASTLSLADIRRALAPTGVYVLIGDKDVTTDLLGVVIGATVILIFGAIDDIHGLSPLPKLFGQTLGA